MSSPDYSQDVKDIIDGLGDLPTPDAIYHAVRSYSVDHVVAAAASAAKGGGGGGGSQTVRLLGPYTVTQADVPNEEGAFFDLPYVPTHGDVILDVICRLVEPFDAGGPVRLTVSDGATGNIYGSGWNLDTPSDTSVNGAEPMQDYLRVVDPGVGVPLFMGGTPPVAQTVRISYADVPVAVGEVALYFLVATPSL